jgi:hypothetical protein
MEFYIEQYAVCNDCPATMLNIISTVILFPDKCFYDECGVEECPVDGTVELNLPVIQRVYWNCRAADEKFRVK